MQIMSVRSRTCAISSSPSSSGAADVASAIEARATLLDLFINIGRTKEGTSPSTEGTAWPLRGPDEEGEISSSALRMCTRTHFPPARSAAAAETVGHARVCHIRSRTWFSPQRLAASPSSEWPRQEARPRPSVTPSAATWLTAGPKNNVSQRVAGGSGMVSTSPRRSSTLGLSNSPGPRRESLLGSY